MRASAGASVEVTLLFARGPVAARFSSAVGQMAEGFQFGEPGLAAVHVTGKIEAGTPSGVIYWVLEPANSPPPQQPPSPQPPPPPALQLPETGSKALAAGLTRPAAADPNTPSRTAATRSTGASEPAKRAGSSGSEQTKSAQQLTPDAQLFEQLYGRVPFSNAAGQAAGMVQLRLPTDAQAAGTAEQWVLEPHGMW